MAFLFLVLVIFWTAEPSPVICHRLFHGWWQRWGQ